MGCRNGPGSQFWKGIWKLQVPERVKTFIWLVGHNRLATGSLTRKWDGGSGVCQICNKYEENGLHALRDCMWAKEVWGNLVQRNEEEEFFRASWRHWIKSNLSNRARTQGNVHWPELFATGCWAIWKWRNQKIHGHADEVPGNAAFNIKQYQANYMKRWDGELMQQRDGGTSYISWYPPKEGWCKLNTDGTLKRGGQAGCGGLIRGNEGEWIRGFAVKLNVGTIKEAEAWGILEGLSLCWDLGFKKIEVESDDATLIADLTTKGRISGCYLLSRKIEELVDRNWEINFTYVQREGNRSADALASLCWKREEIRTIWIQPPEEVQEALQNDLLGNGVYRHVYPHQLAS